MKYKDLVDRRMEEISKLCNGDFKEFARVLVCEGGRPEKSNYKLWNLRYLICGTNFDTLAHKYGVDDSDSKFYQDTMELSEDLNKDTEIAKSIYNEIMKNKQAWCEHLEVTPEMCPKQVPDQLEEFLLKARGLKEWPTGGIPIHWHIVVNDEVWFNELANLHENEDPNKGDFTEIHYTPGYLIKIAGWRGNTMFTLPLYPKEEKPVYTLKEGIEKISEFIIAGKIKILGFEYN